MNRNSLSLCLRISASSCILALTATLAATSAAQKPALTGQNAFTDAAHEAPGTRRHLTLADLPEPAPDQSVDNGAHVVPRPDNAWPVAPKGFKVELYATGLDNPRLLRTAPNGDIFLAESETGKIDATSAPQPSTSRTTLTQAALAVLVEERATAPWVAVAPHLAGAAVLVGLRHASGRICTITSAITSPTSTPG